MYTYALLTIGTEKIILIIGLLIEIGLFWFAVIKYRQSVMDEVEEKINKKADKTEIENQLKSVGAKMDTYEAYNTRTHAEMKTDLTMSENRVKEDYHRGIDQLQDFMKEGFKEIKEDIRNLKR